LDTGTSYVLAQQMITTNYTVSIASSDIATNAVRLGSRLITHLFNAMPQLHHRDPSIIGLLGASPHLASPFMPLGGGMETHTVATPTTPASPSAGGEAFIEQHTPPQSPMLAATRKADRVSRMSGGAIGRRRSELHLEKGQVADMAFERPYYELIVDGIHLHPNSVRVSTVTDLPCRVILVTLDI
jgi:N-acetylglucosamine-6-phosphate deacetylase